MGKNKSETFFPPLKLSNLTEFIPDTQLPGELCEPFFCAQISFRFDSQGWTQS